MCGIFAYVGKENAYSHLIKGLRKLEYRGYDSAGISLHSASGEIKTYKKKGKVNDLVTHIADQPCDGTIGIGHTRWATHGPPNDVNSHPHISNNGRLSLIHNGIIENYAVLKKALIERGYQFYSDTDTEVLVNFIYEIQQQGKLSITEAVRQALSKVIGAYAIVVMDKEDNQKLVGARKSSPLVLGIGDNELLLASDATPILPHTKEVVYLNDGEIVTLHSSGTYDITDLTNEKVIPIIKELDYSIEQLEKAGYEHFMLKEIFEQTKTVKESMRGRIDEEELSVRLGGLINADFDLKGIERIVFIACGTSWHSGLIAEYMIEDLARIPVEVEYASEFRYRNPIIKETDLFVAISQSGETADTLAALELAKSQGAKTFGVVNVVGSSIARLADTGSYIHAGPEIGVASTKAFTSQITVLAILAVYLGELHGKLSQDKKHRLLKSLMEIPQKIAEILKQEEQIKTIALELKSTANALYLGRGYNFPVALEGALKLKEISYIHAEGYPAAEMKHGPIALIDSMMPVILIATNKSAHDKLLSNLHEIKARNGKVVAIVTSDQAEFKKIADFCIEIPDSEEELSPLLSVIPLQLLAYYIAVFRGCNVDQPRNLAKSVTVE
jgi:glucosamine--fructose-6-phosphate aminotransferase (isomerizing)